MNDRFVKETHVLMRNLAKYTDSQVQFSLVDETDLRNLQIDICPKLGPYCGGKFRFGIRIRNAYPLVHPEVVCMTDIYHPNIDSDVTHRHNICLNLFSEWSPRFGLLDVIQGLLYLLHNPNMTDRLNSQVSDYESYECFTLDVKRAMRGEKLSNGVQLVANDAFIEYERHQVPHSNDSTPMDVTIRTEKCQTVSVDLETCEAEPMVSSSTRATTNGEAQSNDERQIELLCNAQGSVDGSYVAPRFELTQDELDRLEDCSMSLDSESSVVGFYSDDLESDDDTLYALDAGSDSDALSDSEFERDWDSTSNCFSPCSSNDSASSASHSSANSHVINSSECHNEERRASTNKVDSTCNNTEAERPSTSSGQSVRPANYTTDVMSIIWAGRVEMLVGTRRLLKLAQMYAVRPTSAQQLFSELGCDRWMQAARGQPLILRLLPSNLLEAVCFSHTLVNARRVQIAIDAEEAIETNCGLLMLPPGVSEVRVIAVSWNEQLKVFDGLIASDQWQLVDELANETRNLADRLRATQQQFFM